MEEKKLEYASKLLRDLDILRRIDKLLNNKDKPYVNVVFHQHYGSTTEYEEVHVDVKHTPRFVDLLKTIITEIETEIKSI